MEQMSNTWFHLIILNSNFDRTGKSYLLRGEETREKGLAVYAVEEIFKTVQPSKQPQSSVLELKKLKVHCSIFFVYHELCVDLIQRSTLTFEVLDSIFYQETYNH